jgi:hypothetical protein
MDYSKIKMELLRSGLPLESMIAESIDSLSSKLTHPLINHGEYFFQRQETEFPNSVDFVVTYDLDIENCDFVQLVFLIECKYRTQETGWYFVPNPLKDSGMEFFVENFFSGVKCSWKTFPSLAPPLGDTTISIVGKGIEIYSNGSRNEKSINEGIHQLMFATSTMLDRAFFSEGELTQTMDERGINIRGRSFHSLLCPIMVTTSSLYFLKGIDVQKIEKSEKLDDITSAGSLLVCSTPTPPIYIKKYIRENVERNVISTLGSKTIPLSSLKSFLLKYSTFHPSRYYITNYQNINDFIQKYIDFAGKMLTIACKNKTE